MKCFLSVCFLLFFHQVFCKIQARNDADDGETVEETAHGDGKDQTVIKEIGVDTAYGQHPDGGGKNPGVGGGYPGVGGGFPGVGGGYPVGGGGGGHGEKNGCYPGGPCLEKSGIFPDPSSCCQFIQCSHCKPYIQKCGPKTHFNPYKKVCDYPEKAHCKSANRNCHYKVGYNW